MIFVLKSRIISVRNKPVTEFGYSIVEADSSKVDLFCYYKNNEGQVHKILLPLHNMTVKIFMQKEAPSFGLKAEYEQNELSLVLTPGEGNERNLAIFKRFPRRNKKFEDLDKMKAYMTKDLIKPSFVITELDLDMMDKATYGYGYGDKINYCKFVLDGSDVDANYFNARKLFVVLMNQQLALLKAYINFLADFQLNKEDAKSKIENNKDFCKLFVTLTGTNSGLIFSITYIYLHSKHCRSCGKKCCEMMCEACKCAYYCDEYCQAKDWPIHQTVCASVKQGYDNIYGIKPSRIKSYFQENQNHKVMSFKDFKKAILRKMGDEKRSDFKATTCTMKCAMGKPNLKCK